MTKTCVIRKEAINFGNAYIHNMRKQAKALTDGSSERQVATIDKILFHFPNMLMDYTNKKDYHLMFKGYLLARGISPSDMIPELDHRQCWITNRLDMLKVRKESVQNQK